MSTAHAGWRITNRSETRTGLYVAINVQALGRPGMSIVTVKHRSLPGGPPFVCLTCLRNSCTHIDFVAAELGVAPETPEVAA
jgi:hypothetical protein